jgi:spermidine synthase
VAARHAMQLGLGAGALTKFCRRQLRMKTTVIELNPQVLVACRGWFKLPPDDARLQVVIADAAQSRSSALNGRGMVDALQVDLYDHEAAAPVLDDEAFYAQCRALLTDEGCITVNLFGRASSYERSLDKIAAAFGEEAVWAFKPTREGNTVVLAQRTPTRPSREALAARGRNHPDSLEPARHQVVAGCSNPAGSHEHGHAAPTHYHRHRPPGPRSTGAGWSTGPEATA